MSGFPLVLKIALVVAVLGFFLYRLLARRDKWGINTKRVSCPECGEPQPIVRRPKSFQQAMWGGYSCEKCGAEMDKWGNRRP